MFSICVRVPAAPVQDFFSNIFSACFYFQRATIIHNPSLLTQQFYDDKRVDMVSNIDRLWRQIGWFYRQLRCNPGNLVLYFHVNSRLHVKFPYGIN